MDHLNHKENVMTLKKCIITSGVYAVAFAFKVEYHPRVITNFLNIVSRWLGPKVFGPLPLMDECTDF